LTTQEKLNVAWAEAEMVGAKVGEEPENLNIQFEGFQEDEDRDKLTLQVPPSPERANVEEKKEEFPMRKTKVSGRVRRRKSTLTPEELENLMFN
jgi:hypothetical protein